MNEKTTSSFSEQYARLKKERDMRHEERVRWETETQALERQLAELDKKIKDELGVDPADLATQTTELESEAARLITEVEGLLKAPAPTS